MKLVPLIIAVLVSVALYFIVLDRETLVSFASGFGAEETAEAPPDSAADTATEVVVADDDGRVHVTARRSEAQTSENSVLLRGRTEAVRQVDVASETSGRIVSDPIRAGAFIEAGTIL